MKRGVHEGRRWACGPGGAAVLVFLLSGCMALGGPGIGGPEAPHAAAEAPPDSLPPLPMVELEAPEVDVDLLPLPQADLPPDTVMLPPARRADFFEALRIIPLGAGTASYYGPGFAGRRTASGERFNPGAMTAAHRTLPFGSRVRVTNLKNNRSVVVRINDRGPFAGRRIIDLSQAAAKQLGMIRSGTARVELELLPDEEGEERGQRTAEGG